MHRYLAYINHIRRFPSPKARQKLVIDLNMSVLKGRFSPITDANLNSETRIYILCDAPNNSFTFWKKNSSYGFGNELHGEVVFVLVPYLEGFYRYLDPSQHDLFFDR